MNWRAIFTFWALACFYASAFTIYIISKSKVIKDWWIVYLLITVILCLVFGTLAVGMR